MTPPTDKTFICPKCGLSLADACVARHLCRADRRSSTIEDVASRFKPDSSSVVNEALRAAEYAFGSDAEPLPPIPELQSQFTREQMEVLGGTARLEAAIAEAGAR